MAAIADALAVHLAGAQGVDLSSLLPAAHSAWLAGRIPGARLVSEPGASHAGHFDATPDALRWLLNALG